jgi:hypothetical protein
MNWLRKGVFVAALLASVSLAFAQSPGAGQGVPNTGGGGGSGGGVSSVTITPGTNLNSSGTCSGTGAINCTLNAATQVPSGSPGYIAGGWFENPLMTGASPPASSTGSNGGYYCVPFTFSQPVHVETIEIRIVATSTGNTSAALSGALFSDLVPSTGTSANTHRPGALIEYGATPFATGTATVTSAALANGNDAITAGIIWECVSAFDSTATWVSTTGANHSIAAWIGSQTAANVMSNAANTSTITSVSATGTFNCTASACSAPASFTASTTWTENASSNRAPDMPIQIFSVP